MKKVDYLNNCIKHSHYLNIFEGMFKNSGKISREGKIKVSWKVFC